MNSEKGKSQPKLSLDETPVQFADRLGIEYTSIVNPEHKKELGQFFTPAAIARFMSEFVLPQKTKYRILDPGCGIGILSCALLETIYKNSTEVFEIELVAFENDLQILPFAEECFTYLSSWLRKRNISITYFLCKNDFILHNTLVLNNQQKSNEFYDIVIANPPYFKLAKNDARITAAKSVIFGQSNIYSIFLIIAAKLLSPKGQLIFITPRSFCSGSYFRLFREIFFSLVEIKNIHLFNSRKDAFKRDKVLQENIIVVANKYQNSKDKVSKKSTINNYTIELSASKGIDDLKKSTSKEYIINDLVNLKSYQKIIHLPTSVTDENVITVFKTWSESLKTFGWEISTGPVVDFRSMEFISSKSKKNTVPLIWLHNIEAMKLLWPNPDGYRGKVKDPYIIDNEKSRSRLINNQSCVLLRRFSTKDDSKRLIAAPLIRSEFSRKERLGIENHLNYIYKQKGELSTIEAIGFSALLNSSLFDIYFRTFNGNINVSATELRDFPLPHLNLIKELGRQVQQRALTSVSEIDNLVSQIFNITVNLSSIYYG